MFLQELDASRESRRRPSLSRKLGSWPGAKGVARRKHRRVNPFPGGSDRLPQEGAGRSGDRRASLSGEEAVTGIRDRLARPVQGIEVASWLLRATPLTPGLAAEGRPPLERRPFIIRFVRFTVFQAPAPLEVMTFWPTQGTPAKMPGGLYSRFRIQLISRYIL
jgi:hypothetical protein